MIATAAPLASCCATLLAAAASSSSRLAASPRCCSSSDDDAKLIADTYDWLDGFVIKHNLCPFASGVRSQTRTVVCRDDALNFVANEAKLLRAVDANQPATTLVCLPLFGEFEQLMEFQEAAEAHISRADAAAIQLLAFHPLAEFETPEDPADLSLRSPHPLIHLLRDADVVAAEEQWMQAHGEPPSIQERNAAYLRGLGWPVASRLREGGGG